MAIKFNEDLIYTMIKVKFDLISEIIRNQMLNTQALKMPKQSSNHTINL